MNSHQEFVSSLSKETKWHGNHDENDCQLLLKAGYLSMVYENGNLRYIAAGNHELIRMIYPAVRDREWLKINPVISGEEVDLKSDSFSIKFTALYKTDEINFHAKYKIEGNTDNSLNFSLEGEAINAFEKNRIGFCVLYPIEGCSGKSCLIVHTNNEKEILEFPRLISPRQPFCDIKSMRWKISEIDCTLDFYGDVFETEDQRNWTDASYKTYCTPLNRQFPVRLQRGEKIIQKVELKIEGDFDTVEDENTVIEITINPEKISGFPKIGIGSSTRPEPLTEEEILVLKELRFDHYRVDLYLFDPDWKLKAELAVDEANRLDYLVEFALFFDDNAVNQSTDFIEWSTDHAEIALIILFDKTEKSTPDLLTDTLAPMFKEAFPGVKIGCGTNANFAQLNRNRPQSLQNDYICYSVHPQEHASDNSTLIENLKAQDYTVESAAFFANGKGVWISPVNIQRRFNANIRSYEQLMPESGFPSQVDSRIMSLFGACWTTGSLKYLSESGIKGVTYFETVGERGIIQGDFPSRWPKEFISVRGMIFPVFFVLQFILKYKSCNVVKSNCSHPLWVDSLILLDGSHYKMIIVNFTAFSQKVFFVGCLAEGTVQQFNAENYAGAVSNPDWFESGHKAVFSSSEPLHLEPFSISFVDG